MVKEQKLAAILSEGYKVSIKEIPYITAKDIESKGLDKEILTVYKSLGGKLDFPNLPFLQEHIILESDIILILDDERKFNRYRAQTIKSPIYKELPYFPLEKYKSFCRTYETQCLKSASHASAWTSREAEKSFGKGGDFGDLDMNGAPLWKEIAIQDFILDHIPLIFGFKVLRIGVWENILINSKMHKISDLLLTSRADLNKSLFKFLERKVTPHLPSPASDTLGILPNPEEKG